MIPIIDNLREVLFIRLGAIGDVVHTIPTFQALKKLKPELNIDYLTGPFMTGLLEEDKALRTVIPLDDSIYKSYLSLYKLAREVSKVKYDAVINLQPGMKTFFLTRILNPKYTFTYKKYRPSVGGNYIHVVNNYFKTIKPLLSDMQEPLEIEVNLGKEILEWSEQELLSNNITEPVGIVPGVSKYRANKLWMTENWKKLLNYLAIEKGNKVLIFGGIQESELADELRKVNEEGIYNLCGDYNVLQTAAMLSKCKIVIGCDTGPTHIATAVGPKVIGLYGPTSPDRVGLFGDKHLSIGEKGQCHSCEKKKCREIESDQLICPCMEKITVEDVINCIEEYL